MSRTDEPLDSMSNSSSEARRGPCRTTSAPTTDARFAVPLRGVEVGPSTRCVHYHGPQDIIAIRFACCDVFYPCHACHEVTTDHAAERWPADAFDTPAVFCGCCEDVLTIEAYLAAEHTCPSCGTAFNPNCVRHHDQYFDDR